MNKIGGILILLLVFLTLLTAVPLNFTVHETSHTVILPLERSFIFSIKFQNNGNKDILIGFLPEDQRDEDWLIILPSGRLRLSPGEEVEIIATFEPTRFDKREGEINFNFKFEVDNEIHIVPLKVRYIHIDMESFPTENTRIEVYDAKTRQPIPGAKVILSLPSGLMVIDDITHPDGAVELRLPSSSYIQSLYEKYNATVSFNGYFLEIYKAFYTSGVKTGENIKVYLEPQKEYFEYEKVGEVQTEYAIWWIRAPGDSSYIVTSPGTHAHVEPPNEAAIYIFNTEGQVISRYPIKVENYEATDICWGLDVSPNGSYIAAGCYDGSVYLFDKIGKLVSTYKAEGTVRWVKFSPDGKYLAFGPTERGADYFGLFRVPDLTPIWEDFVGDWSRTVAFSEDGDLVAVGSSNGVLTLFNTKGEKIWQTSNGGLVPFVIGFDVKGDRIVTGGKGRTLIVYDKSGKILWKKYLDHVLIAGGISANGAVAVGTVGGIVYYFNPDGSLSFRRIQGGIEHNGLYMTRNGKYILLGGMNPTLLDSNGTILWQLKPEEETTTHIRYNEINAVNTVYLSEDASIMILGYNNGKIEFWKRKTTTTNNQQSTKEKETSPKEETKETPRNEETKPTQPEPKEPKTKQPQTEQPPSLIPAAILAILVITIITALLLKHKKTTKPSS